MRKYVWQQSAKSHRLTGGGRRETASAEGMGTGARTQSVAGEVNALSSLSTCCN